MVDLQTAMAAAQASDRRSRDGRGASDEKKKRRSGSDLGIEPFDPVKYVSKEKADTSSMWLVILFAFTVTALMRYALMPSTTMDKTDILYMLPLVMIILIPQIHRTVMPERFQEHYTKGTWFRAAFLYTFTFLSLSFLLGQPSVWRHCCSSGVQRLGHCSRQWRKFHLCRRERERWPSSPGN